MDQPGYVVLSRLAAQLRATQVLANNLANADTPGFRAERPVFASFVTRSPDQGEVRYSLDRATWRDGRPGPIGTTGNPLDLALRGDGFFVLETPNGDRYTRAGRFTLDAAGRITDADGHAVLDTRGAPITLSPADSRIEIQSDGTVRSENGVVAQLRIVRFASPERLKAEGARLFAAEDAPEDMPRPQLVQGAVEGSNVSAIGEMTRLTEQVRQFQFATQFAEREGDRLSTAVDRILRRRN
ncbi:flagellar basal-body rod protein FlgF [Paeniroseomonas aquatica]|uniref:Flagellar basal-body rod protein FlgF n=1 Tax=Paeniroseomonas aquatica TaxID=373043 RepID=A0ABT8AC01_9PROT|nr:flagellar basal-body rod protein FlgF [Paeniroseomonas aquatica]MDN3567352.1 flagellar basal-body rod protein FlgF [Paeniroseomonas aquatica]